uniref:Large ribosomal subunit protein uL23 N-terminal domain-containing protein n=1 Tax=Chelydra serpentina TaxID=8475 RepID=A0A8C3RQ89_CHESE
KKKKKKKKSPMKAKSKALKAKKAVLKGVHSHKKKKIRTSPIFRRKSAPRRNKPDHCITNTLVFIVDVKANKTSDQYRAVS